MRCRSCNIELTDEESVRKDVETNDYIDMCTSCYYDSLENTYDINIYELI